MFKALYCALVRSNLEYCTVAWKPFTGVQIEKIESVQKQFLLVALRSLGWNHPFMLPRYEDRLRLLTMIPLNDRRTIFDAVFMYKLMNDEIDVPNLRNSILENGSTYATRFRSRLIYDSHSTSYGMNEPITRMIRLYNSHRDIFENCNSINTFKSKIRIEVCG